MDTQPLRIAGFGACMITGYPHMGGGLFEVACTIAEESLSRRIESVVVSLGGFTAHRAQTYLKKKLFNFNPHYIVIQFGATDAQCPIRKNNLKASRGSKSSIKPSTASRNAQYLQSSMLSYFRWELASLLGSLRKLEPIAPISLYTAAIETMVADCRSAGITPVVLTPFVYGSRYTARKAISYTDALQELHSRVSDMVLVDCVPLLTKFPKTQILQHDGFHLSKLGHKLVGREIGEAIVADATTKKASMFLSDSVLLRDGNVSSGSEAAVACI